jgi:serine protease
MLRPLAGEGRRLVDRSDRERSYVPGQVIVKFRDGASTSARLSVMSEVRASASLRPSYANFDLVEISRDQDAEEVARSLSRQPDVEYAQARYKVRPYFVPNDPSYRRYQWNLQALDMEKAWDINPGATANITVAVIDTGIAYQDALVRYRARAFRDDSGVEYPALGPVDIPFAAAPDLKSAGRFVAPHDFIWNDDTPFDLDGHGTHVSGTIGQLTNNNLGEAGMAFNVKLMPVKVIDTDWDFIFASPNEGTDDVVARGIRYAADNGAKVLNMSIGRTGPPAPVIEDAIRYAVSKGAFVAIAGGNGFEKGNETEVVAEIASRVDGAVSVAAVDRNLNRAYYSTTGSWIELAAPGGAFRQFGVEGGVIQETYDLDLSETFDLPPSKYSAPRFDAFDDLFFTGTSMATPHVSGLAALLMQQGITSPAAVEAAMKRFAVEKGATGRDNEYGFGLINPRLTLRGLGLAK